MLKLVNWRKKWINVYKVGSNWILLDQNGSKWIKLDQNGSKWIKLDHIKTWINRSRDAEASKLKEKKMGQMYIKLGHIGSY